MRRCPIRKCGASGPLCAATGHAGVVQGHNPAWLARQAALGARPQHNCLWCGWRARSPSGNRGMQKESAEHGGIGSASARGRNRPTFSRRKQSRHEPIQIDRSYFGLLSVRLSVRGLGPAARTARPSRPSTALMGWGVRGEGVNLLRIRCLRSLGPCRGRFPVGSPPQPLGLLPLPCHGGVGCWN